jgi:hypothetical protein
MRSNLVKISDISPPFSYVRNTYPNERRSGLLTQTRERLEPVLQREERRRGCLTGSTRKVYQFLPRKLVGKLNSTFSKCHHLPLLCLPKDL